MQRSLENPDAVAELMAKALYEQQYGRVWEDATQWARRDSLSCALTMIETLRQSQVLPAALLSCLPRAPLS
ncbi:hypothetical protein [Azorhizobium sp. AG788]|uniref:hypothetical protein n=1 Tax=Azorhizobium sp. AG788 TaxID=2183897 RepID=UPI003139E493